MADDILEEIRLVVRTTRIAIESSKLPVDASTASVFITAWILVAKNHGVTREKMHEVIDDMWGLDNGG